jgi:hypothetical protein
MTPRRLSAILGIISLVFLAAACSKGHATVSPSARSSVSALATNPAVVQARARVSRQITACVKKISPAQAAKHPITSFRQIISCTITLSGDGTDAVACSKSLIDSGDVGKGKLPGDETAFIRCMTAKIVR